MTIRKFVMFDDQSNHNKEWVIEYDPSLSHQTVTTKWGRVGSTYQQNQKYMSSYQIDSLIREKILKGYNEIELCTVNQVVVGGSTGNKAYDNLIEIWNYEAGLSIKSYLATTVDQLSLNQIRKAQDILRLMQTAPKMAWPAYVREYYNLIPTQLPRKLDIDDLVNGFISDMAEQDNRLQQLAAAVQTISSTPTGNPLSQFGDVTLYDLPDNTIRQIETLCKNTGCKNKISIYGLTLQPERDTYLKEQFGSHNVMTLFHGTSAKNVRHVLRTGLIIPQSAANGSRFGRGIYFADKYQRSYSYVNGTRGRFMFVADVKVGVPWKNSGSDSSFTRAPQGHHSVQGTGSWSGLGDEFIVYLPSQQTIRAIIHIEG